jgi:hypothetical protein
LKELQPTPGFIRLVNEQVLRVWEQEAEVVSDRSAFSTNSKTPPKIRIVLRDPT